MSVATSPEWVLRGTTVIDPRDGTRRPDTDVVIRGDRIHDVAPAGSVTSAGSVVQAAGRYLVPGFNDMHAHPLELQAPRGSLELMLAHGITGYRQMSGSTQLLRRRAAGAGLDLDLGPRLLAMPGALLTPLNAGTAEQAVATVRDQAVAGADFIKVGVVNADVFFVAQDEATRLNVPILGHLPVGIDVVRASRRGLRSIEHLGPGIGLFAPCSHREEHLQAAVRSRPPLRLPRPLRNRLVEPLLLRYLRKAVINPVNRIKAEDVALLREAVASFDPIRARTLAEQFVQDDTWNVPTLVRELTTYLCDSTDLAQSQDLRFIDRGALASWQAAAEKFSEFPADAKSTFHAAYDLLCELTSLFDEVGVKMLAGSDVCGAAWLVPGASLHREFDELARCGLSPLRVLQMTTSRAAEFLETADVTGAVAPGRRADLVVLENDPLTSVDALHEIDGVVRAGRYFDAPALEAIKRDVAAQRCAA